MAQTMPHPMLSGAMMTNANPACMPFAWPVGQTFQGNMVFASVAPTMNFVKASHQQFDEQVNDECNSQRRNDHIASAQSRSLRGHGKSAPAIAPASSDALTSEEIEELRLAVQSTHRKLQNFSSWSEQLVFVNENATRFAKENRFKSNEHDIDTLSSSSSTCLPESNRECGENSADDDAYSPRHSQLYHGAAKNSADDRSISDSDVDRMFVELESSNADRRRMAIEWVVSSTQSLAFTRRGCRIVQRVMELATSADKHQMVENLEGFALEALQSPHANYVLQKCFEIASPIQAQKILSELKGQGAFVARHRFGCRVLQRAMEYCSLKQNEEWIADVLMDAAQLVRHTYGNFVIQHVLQYGTPSHVHQIAEVLMEDAARFSKHRIASHVMSCALSCCSPDDVLTLTELLSGEEGQLDDLARRQYGSFVAREVNRVNSRLRGVVGN